MKHRNAPTDDQLSSSLMDQLNRELDKEINEQDADLIDTLIAQLDEVNGDCYAPDPKIKKRELKKLSRAFAAAKQEKTPLRPKWKISAAIACAVVFIFSSSVMVTAALTSNSPIAVFEQWGRAILNLPYNEPIEVNGVTFIRNKQISTYNSVEELVREQELNVLIPTWLPDEVVLDEVVYIDNMNGEEVQFVYSNSPIWYIINLYDLYGDSIERIFSNDIKEINGLTCYFVQLYGKVEAIFVDNGYTYSVSANDNDTLFRFIEGLSEV